jgi:hypothetical protein
MLRLFDRHAAPARATSAAQAKTVPVPSASLPGGPRGHHFRQPPESTEGCSRRGKCRLLQHWAQDLDQRLAWHRSGHGARLIEVIVAAGIGFVLARTWGGDRTLERRLKNRKVSPRLSPICRAIARPGPRPDA